MFVYKKMPFFLSPYPKSLVHQIKGVELVKISVV